MLRFYRHPARQQTRNECAPEFYVGEEAYAA